MATSLDLRPAPAKAFRRTRLVGLSAAAGLTFAIAAPATLTPPASAAPSTNRTIPTSVQDGQWQQLADRIYPLAASGYDAQTAAGQPIWSFDIASMAHYAGLRFGWHDPRTKTWLQRLY